MEQWYIQRDLQKQKDTIDELSLAFSTLFLNRTNRSGIIKAGVIGGKNQNKAYKLDCRFNKETIINRIRLIASYSKQIRVCNYDAKDFIEAEIKKHEIHLHFLIHHITIKDLIYIQISTPMMIMLSWQRPYDRK